MSDTIVYEYPLTEKMRCYLRIEHLSEQLIALSNTTDFSVFKSFFGLLFALAEQTDRGELKKELIRDIDAHKLALTLLRHDQNIDHEKLEDLIQRLAHFNFSQPGANKSQLLISQDPLLTQIKNKSSLPGGGCQFDTPMLHYWCQLPDDQRQKRIKQWLAPFQQTIDAIALLLTLTRESRAYSETIATDGFYQSNCDKTQLIRIKLSIQQGCYPTVSGYRSRYSIRFIAWDEQPVHGITFDLACC